MNQVSINTFFILLAVKHFIFRLIICTQFDHQLSEFFGLISICFSYHRSLNPYEKCFRNKPNTMAGEQGEVLALLIKKSI